MGSACNSSLGNTYFCSPDNNEEQFENHKASRNARSKITERVPSKSILTMHSKKKPLSPIPQESDSRIEPPDAPEMDVDLGLFGVDNDTLRLLLTLDDMSNDNLVSHVVDIDSQSKQQCPSDPAISPKKDNTFKPKITSPEEPADEYSSDSSDGGFFHKSCQNQRKSHLIRVSSNDYLESDEYDDLAEEMTREYRRLSEASERSSISYASEPIRSVRLQLATAGTQSSNLFRMKSSNKWDANDIDEQRDEITKQILHLQSTNSAASNK